MGSAGALGEASSVGAGVGGTRFARLVRLEWVSWLAFAPLMVAASMRGLWAPDEPRRAEVARELIESGQWLVLRLCGEPYPDKPPLFFWLVGVVGKLSDWNELAMRAVPLAATALTAWLVARVARVWFGALEARLAPVLFLTTVMLSMEGHQLQIDPLLMVSTTAALSVLAGGLGSSRRPRRGQRALLASALVGLGGLAKGPVAFVDVGLPLLAWSFWERRAATRPAHAGPSPRLALPVRSLVPLLAIGPVLVWALAVSLREPVFAQELFWAQHAGRIVRAEDHPGAPWKSVIRLPVLLLPWTVPVWIGLVRAWRLRRTPAERELVRAALWFASLVLFFSIIPTKRDVYLLPAYPAAALIGARALALAVTEERRLPALAWTGRLVLCVVATGGLALVWIGERLGLPRGPAAVGGLATALPALLGLAALRTDAPLERSVRHIVLGWSGALLAAGLLLVPLVDPLKSSEGVARWLAGRSERPSSIPCFGVQPEGYRFYGGVPTVRPSGPVESALDREGADFLALVRDHHWEELDEATGVRMRVLKSASVGGREFVIVGTATH